MSGLIFEGGGDVASAGPWTGDDRGHNDQCHARWYALGNRSAVGAAYRDEWYSEQCGGCRYWVALRGESGADYGVCSSAESAFDGRVRFEHDGCDCFTVREDGSFG
ncbi:DUF3027 domain-containing protein [Kitasatospora sp. NPDC057692]|uniref:DUF3027 domain-containing protein n=1 Tax=Kitasatospora sp. NPDC057692 TaxID=3346215 RepID=UPI0036CEC5D1